MNLSTQVFLTAAIIIFALNSHLFFFFPQQHVCSHIITLPHFLFSWTIFSCHSSVCQPEAPTPARSILSPPLTACLQVLLIGHGDFYSFAAVCMCSSTLHALSWALPWLRVLNGSCMMRSPSRHVCIFFYIHRHTHTCVLLTRLVPSQPL